jgi:hypothetical protein
MPDLFGEEIVLIDAPKQPRRGGKDWLGGYAMRPGSGPAGERCGTCRHDVKVNGGTRDYHKCALCKPNWTHGPGSDIKQRSPACSKWERKE